MRIYDDFQKIYDRLGNINSFQKGFNTFLDNRSLLGLKGKVGIWGTSRPCVGGIPPDVTLMVPQVGPTGQA